MMLIVDTLEAPKASRTRFLRNNPWTPNEVLQLPKGRERQSIWIWARNKTADNGAGTADWLTENRKDN